MKGLVTKKQKFSHESKDNLHHCGAISTRSLVQKKADPGAFTISCTVGSLNFTKEICDLGANINLMTLSVYKKLGLGDPTPTNMRLVMVDRSVKRPVGILHDVLVKVADFILPADFIFLDCEVDFEVPIILGIPFLATRREIVDMKLHELKFRFNDNKARFKIHSSMRQKKKISVLSIVDVLYGDGKEVLTGCLGKV
ncbi:uncharacterized protein LOC124896226 [Capsicum annuum]|uniref:uncharacterized protein LOC124896226 n=1 Tax=Capsicum annuum TaxID=4072 RepID=UPI001FB17453|nr:uncharacterized protein LOC124896226 [Capsicum annuum]